MDWVFLGQSNELSATFLMLAECELETRAYLSNVSSWIWTNCPHGLVRVVWVTACGLCYTPTAEQTEQSCVFQGSAYGGRFTLSASSCGSIKALAEWICGHLLWTEIQGAELYSARICNACLDLTLHALHADNKHFAAQTLPSAGTRALCATIPVYNAHDQALGVIFVLIVIPEWVHFMRWHDFFSTFTLLN